MLFFCYILRICQTDQRLTGAQVWDFDLLDFNFFIMKSLLVGYFRDEIKILHILQMGEIRAIMFLLPQSTEYLTICYRMRSVC
jgi:hypothetical protein